MNELESFKGHASGLCNVAYARVDGGYNLVTCGSDGKILVRSHKDGGPCGEIIKRIDASGVEDVGLTGLCIAPNGSQLCVSDDSNFVKVYSLPEGTMGDILTRFVLPPRCVSLSPSGIHLAAGGDDDMIKMIDIQNKKVFKSIKCGGYVRGLEYDPESIFLATTCADGTFTVYEISSGNVMLSKRKGCTKVDPGSPSRVVPSWHPDGGSLVAVPCHDGSIALYERLSWDVTDELSGGHESPVQLVKFSKNGLYLATTANDKTVAVWDMSDKMMIQKKVLPACACGMIWHPTENKIVFGMEDGTVTAWENPVPATLPGPCQDVDLAAADGGRGNALVDDAAQDHSQDEYSEGSDDAGSDLDRNDDTFVVDDSPFALRKKMKRHQSLHMKDSKRLRSYRGPISVEPQKAVQPGSTQMELGRRYLCYNSLGYITLRTESDHNIVEVSFHDTAEHRRRIPLLNDFYGFTMGSLGSKGALYASPSSEHAPSTVVYRPFESWSSNAEWTIGLKEGEEAVSIAAGDSFCVIATNSRLVRVLTASGLQTKIFSVPGNIVSVFAQSDAFGVVYHMTTPSPQGDQILAVKTFSFSQGSQIANLEVALSPGSILSWVGYTDEQALAIYDSEGVLRMFSPDFGGSWVPIFDSAVERKGSESFWLFSVSLEAGEAQCIVCADTLEPLVPSGSARPVVTAAPLRIPLVNHDEALVGQEQTLLRKQLLTTHYESQSYTGEEDKLSQHEIDADKACLGLFKLLLQQDKASRALDVASRLQTMKALEGALRIAYHFNMNALAERIEVLINCKQEMESEDHVYEEQPLNWDINQVPAVPEYGNLGAIVEELPLVSEAKMEVQENGEPNSIISHRGSDNLKSKRKVNPFARKK